MRKTLLPLVLLTATVCAHAAELDNQFQNPPPSARPRVFWMWLRTDTTPAAITKDLEEMKAKGIEGFILYDSGAGSMSSFTSKMVLDGKVYRNTPTNDFKGANATRIPGDALESWTPHWRDLIRFVAKECARLGLNFTLSNGLAGTSAPMSEEYGQQQLVWSTTPVAGPQTFDGVLPFGVLKSRKAPPKNAPTPPPPSIFHDVEILAVPDKATVLPEEVINLTTQTDAAGHLHWQAPAGNWKVLRFTQVPTHARNVWGPFTDGMSAEAMDKTWELTMAPLLKEMTPEERVGLRGIEDDSWEGGDMTWTKKFADEFKRRRGYDLLPLLPVVAGQQLVDAATSEGVLRDYQVTISDLVVDNHYGRLQELAHANNLTFHSEAAGPHPTQQDLLKNCGKVDEAMGEFWVPSPHRPTPESRFLLRNAANSNHLYGRTVTMCESFTSVGPYWEDTFFDMKGTADQAFCDGLNKICFHNYSHSPSLTAKPGYAYFAGTFYGRTVTWWEQTPAFNNYLARCSYLLQQGKFVADAVLYRGDNIGHLEEMKTLQPTLGEGYDHDNCNSEVLLTRMSVRDGRIVLPDGMSYRVLVLPENTPMELNVLTKIASMVDSGATVVGPRPTGLAGRQLNPGNQAKFDALVTRLWGSPGAVSSAGNRPGTGRVASGPTAREVLTGLGVGPDFEQKGLSPAGTMDWIHRTADGTEIYYVTSRWPTPEKVECAFRVSGKQPELFDPVTGEVRDARAFRQEKGRTVVPLEFGPCGSMFVVFRRPIAPDAIGPAKTNFPAFSPLTTLAGPWVVNFDPKWGGPEKVTFDHLDDWSKRSEDGIQHYSGTAVYHQTFNLAAAPAKGTQTFLDLGEVHEVSSVRLNGIDLGVVWTKPARTNVTRALKPAANVLEITVVNLWPNRMIGDASLPPEKRFTETNMHKFSAATPLYPSGLLGPVQLVTSTSN